MAREKGSGSLQMEPSGRFTMRLCIDGKRLSKTTRTKNRLLAESRLRRFVCEHCESDKTIFFGDSWSVYMMSPLRKDMRAATLESKRQIWGHFLNWIECNYPGTNQLRDITRKMVEAFLLYLKAGHAATTYNNRVCVLREIFRLLEDEAGIIQNPWTGIRLKPNDCHTRRALSVDEIAKLIDCARKAGEEWKRLFEIGIYTGLRLGDCCRLEWSCIDIDRGVIQVIPRKTAKFSHGKPVTIPIHDVLMEMLMKTDEGNRVGAVLSDISVLYRTSRAMVAYRLKKIFKEAGITTSVRVEGRRWKVPEATFHSLRHTFVSIAANAGVPLHVVQSIVGHESSAMTRHYYHENEEVLRKAISSIPVITDKDSVKRASAKSSEQRQSEFSPQLMSELKRMYALLKTVLDDGNGGA